jgi:hypothetical protein
MTNDPHFELGDLKVYLSDVDYLVEQKWKRDEGAFISFVTSDGNYIERIEVDPKKAIQFAKQSLLLMAEISKRQDQP